MTENCSACPLEPERGARSKGRGVASQREQSVSQQDLSGGSALPSICVSFGLAS
jgi:hypothetical protein